jgi:ElaB/YqjD/DUF883 family membrane-anchored ribosome-binding protein
MADKTDPSERSITERATVDDVARRAASSKEAAEDVIRSTRDTLAGAGSDLSERAAQMKDRLSSMARTAIDTIDERRSIAADGLETTASTLHERADRLPGGERVSGFAHAAADRLSTTADYVRTHRVNRMMNDVETLVKNNPGPSLALAALFGFFVGRALSRD